MKNKIIYTDGACEPNPGNGGWGFVILNNPKNITVYGGEINTTNNRMELMALIMALEYFDTPQQIIFFSDSKYVVKGFNTWMHNWEKAGKQKKNMDLWEELLLLKSFHKKVTGNWVRGHSGNTYNELADELAVWGMEETVLIAVDNMPL